VAITRARTEMIVYSTLRPEQIDISPSTPRGVTDFKHFLEYAIRGAPAWRKLLLQPEETPIRRLKTRFSPRCKRKDGDSIRKWGYPDFGSILELCIPMLRVVTWPELNVMARPIIDKRRRAIGTDCGKVSWSSWAGGFAEFGAPNGGMTRRKPAKNSINV
jgi:hypothetical protein